MDWEQRYLDDDIPWDHGEAAPAIVEVVSRQIVPEGARVLVPGCGLGHDVRAWSDAGFAATGLDIASTALERARCRYGTDGMSWLQADLFDPELPRRGLYDVVWEHTCYCTLPLELRSAYVDAVARLLKPGGLFCALFFTDTGNGPGEGPPYSADRDEVFELFSPMFDLAWEKRPDQAYTSRVGREWLMVWTRRMHDNI
ncbi:methyltransferase domain-containing protein [Verrucomicrobiaceae bacterium N1E253]|uniref:Methyltransferase domain-containing protein n=1 Tax=Oceaniferula marina TaxID=2748318 RepID=A0A851GCQ3_9BACT|nr:methyltransferase domain-containing protein [Oceaniferula marina]NWK55206.1 methyltransferase domain-containing protein [Oceaniferula marina]